MPNRYVRESAIESERVNQLSWQGEVFFRRLINRVDDFGRLGANPQLLRASIFPLQIDKVSVEDVTRLIKECHDCHLLATYQGGDGKAYIVLAQWEKGRAKASRYPSPPDEIVQQMQTHVYTCLHTSADTPDSDSDSDSDTDPDSDSPLPPKGVPPLALPHGNEFAAAWDEWTKHRTEIKKPLKPTSTKRSLVTLAALTERDAVAMIHHTVANGWQGLREPENKSNNRTNGRPNRNQGTALGKPGQHKRTAPLPSFD